MRSRKISYYVAAFLIPAFIQIFVFACMGFYPFGDKSILVWDMNWQYVSFFSWLTRTIRKTTADSIFYSFSMSYGSSTLGLLGYYLLSPFNVILLLFDTVNLPLGLWIVTILKLSCCGLTMYLFLARSSEQNRKDFLLFSTSYAVMGYNVAQMQNIMWIDAVILLPLVALGIKNYVKKKKFGLFVLSLAAAVAINFYTGYMLCLFSAIYLLAEVALDSEQFVFKKIFKKYFGGLFYIVLAVMMSGFSLLPVYYEISGSRMKESSLSSTFYMLKNLDSRMWELGNKLCIGTYNVHQLKSGLPNIYAGCLCFVLFILFFVSRKYKVSKKEKKIYAITCVVLLLSFVSVGVNMIWHGFAQANGSPYRYSFFVSFLMIEIASRQYLKIQEGQEMVRKKDAAELVNIGIAAILGAFLLYKGFVQYKIDESDYLNLSQILLTVGFILVWFILLKLRKSHKMMIGTYKSYCMLFFLIIELGLNMGIDISHFSYEKIGEYQAYVQETESVLKQIRKLDADPFYRIENDIRYEQRNCNDAMLLGYPSITHYSSVLPYSVSKYASEEGMSSYPGSLSVVYKKEEANAEAAGRNGIKYLITKSLPDNMQGWTLFSQDASVNILKNTAYQPMIRFENEKCETRIESVENGKIATKLFNENEKPEKLIILIPWHQGWQLKLDGKDIVPDKYKSAMMEVMIPIGNHELTMNFHPVYLKEGTIVSVISTVLFFGLLFVNHRKSRKRLLILPERGIIY